MRVGGKGYRFDKIALVSCTAEPDEDLSTAQRAPKEYKLQPGELYRGEKEFPNDWSGNLRLTAEPFQGCTENDVLVVSYTLLPGLKEAFAAIPPEEPRSLFGYLTAVTRNLSMHRSPLCLSKAFLCTLSDFGLRIERTTTDKTDPMNIVCKQILTYIFRE